jgi:dolichol kinase
MRLLVGILVAGILFFFVFALSEFALAQKVPAPITRKFAHVGSGVVTALLPLMLTPTAMIGLGVVFSAFILWTKRAQILNSVHMGDENSVGAVVFAPTVTVLTILTMNSNPLIFQGSILILALSDAAAGVVGRYAGSHRPLLLRGKSIEGSIACFGVAALIFFTILFHSTVGDIPILLLYSCIGGLMVTFAEACIHGGWDNVSVPFVASAVLFVLL